MPTRDASWMDDAACRGMELAAFFPKGTAEVTAAARAACGQCPVTRDCLAYSLAGPGGKPEGGIWGGLNEDGRRDENRRRPRRDRRVA